MFSMHYSKLLLFTGTGFSSRLLELQAVMVKILLDNGFKLINVFEHEVVNIKQLIEQYTKYEIQLFGNIKEYVNVKTLKITNSMDENSVLICKPNVKFI